MRSHANSDGSLDPTLKARTVAKDCREEESHVRLEISCSVGHTCRGRNEAFN
jgi:hypothetical protein